MIRRSLVLALAAALSPLAANATDLLQVYEMARNSDPQLATAESNRLYNKEGEVQARAALLPQLNGSASLQRSHSEIERGTGELAGTGKSRSYAIQGQQTLVNFAQFATLRAQKANSLAADYTLESANDDLIVRTSAAYFNVLVAIESLVAAETNEAAAKKQFDYADKRLEVGLAPITDVHEARAEYDQARADTITARNSLQDLYQALTEITGQPVRDLRSLPEDFRPQLPAESSNIDGLIASALDKNPSLRAYQYQVQAAENSVSAARAGHLPTLNLAASVGRDASWGDGVSGSNSPRSDSNVIGVTLNIPIFAGGATQSAVRQALAQRDIAQDTYELQKRALDRNTRNAYQTVVAGISEIEARRLAVVSAQAAYDASQVGLEVGTRTVLDVVQNQRTLYQAQLAYAQARYNFLQNRLLLSQALGSLDVAEVQSINALLTQSAESKLNSGSSTQ
ncbi:TolC family outer membrane protein [Xanthomonas sp. NCPPB 2654]|uniref:TolC family outer membrane protein n=1 Tax=unclassified Xanthomonas TaxID=2643310 RepID=UPI0021E0A56C|nr:MULTISPECIES: TolC family outer membrane protein [unclassified Xanthomonas]MDL5365699.1 TolC family outer membrane protein [Xanthomonas sp. NCPPB 2654]MDR6672458.1 outer membrane protein [Xanthomonas translucens]MEB1528474.1 TolC family outer membrane protein [Xanthomonas campestris pv. campestris]UYC19913.1 TolC family outer membrane protein [Xanthomonas sp. CFBP 8443]